MKLLLIFLTIVLQKSLTIGTNRNGRCPSPQFIASGLSCSTVGNDSVCPCNYKCCRALSMNSIDPSNSRPSYYVQPCEDLRNCTLKCPYGLDINAGCPICQYGRGGCNENTCRSRETCQLISSPCRYVPGQRICPSWVVCVKKH
ncbi:unnamed protein product [Rotaria sp. Silwood1]|nr:unnamed protein product [Rotaria sp. Silwood1]CAF5089598.1 unnamed protein product [Rotaria sp. Silwood1]